MRVNASVFATSTLATFCQWAPTTTWSTQLVALVTVATRVRTPLADTSVTCVRRGSQGTTVTSRTCGACQGRAASVRSHRVARLTVAVPALPQLPLKYRRYTSLGGVNSGILTHADPLTALMEAPGLRVHRGHRLSESVRGAVWWPRCCRVSHQTPRWHRLTSVE